MVTRHLSNVDGWFYQYQASALEEASIQICNKMSLQFFTDLVECSINHTTEIVSGVTVHMQWSIHTDNPLLLDGGNAHLKVLFLLHGRGQTAVKINRLASYLLKHYTSETPLVIVTFDQRNHGDRTVEFKRNGGWDNGNYQHGPDLLSMIDGAVVDLKLIMKYFDSYFPLIQTYNITKIVGGVSMGGHATIRFAVEGECDAALPIVGCFDLTTMLKDRLEKLPQEDQERADKSVFRVSYRDDLKVLEQFPIEKMKVLALFGDDDEIVPMNYSIPFLNRYNVDLVTRDQLDFSKRTFQAAKYSTAHTVTEEMAIDIIHWIYSL